jgi:hypothetical protein
MMKNTLNRNFSESINFVVDGNILHTEHWQGLHVAMCRLIQVSSDQPRARLRHSFQDFYAIEWMLDGSWVPW